MKPETEERLKKIKRISNILRGICKVLLALLICGFFVVMGLTFDGRATLHFSDNSVPLAPLPLPSRLGLAVIVELAMAVKFKGLYHLYRLFGNYGRGDIFTTESAAQIRQLGITALLWAGVTFFWTCIAPVLTQSHLPTLFPFHADSLVTGLVIIVISWFMEMAAEMREENELTV